MSFEKDITDLVRATNKLTEAVNTQISDIHRELGSARQKIDIYVAKAKGEYPLPVNLVSNSLMQDVVNGIPNGFSSRGLTIEAAHPYTSAFEAPYVPERPSNATNDPDKATKDTPYFFNRYTKGPRFPRWGGGLATGWGCISNGHILKITGTPGENEESRQVFLPKARSLYSSHYGVRMWVKLVKGSIMGIGDHSGYRTTAPRGLTVTREQSQNSPQGWFLIDGVVGVSATTGGFGNSLSVGFKSTETIEAYIAMPTIWAFLHPTPSGLSMGGS
ncbi:hypothetical protein [Veronia pacifica]|uniref:Uncharacterized protein n=1 Tax=Veronia pacifica TaxID=1080227 RepID=A0A1C3EEA5_9GAMM|nr:hypothetical protein [Veronia pacifica]ODA31524.1 hypothetical protein A8L45_16635 [Veronia pacifica]